jgi:sec-independent protein translocase protein TatA
MLAGFDNPLHLLIVFAVILLLFGAKRLPELGRGLGAAIRSFKDGLSDHVLADERPDPVAMLGNVNAAEPGRPVVRTQTARTTHRPPSEQLRVDP